MRVGILILPERRWPLAQAQWQAAEDMGFDSAWTLDHLWWRSLRDGPWFSAFTYLAAAAAVTERIRVGTLVTSPNFRHPVTTAKDAMTIDDISGGRFTLGIGSGSHGAGDAQVVDETVLSAADRTARFEEFVGLVDELLRNPVVSYHGRFFTANEARMMPGCVQKPRVPLAIAAAGPKGQEVAVRHGDTWVTCGPVDPSRPCSPDEFHAETARQLDTFSRACDRAGRDVNRIDRMVVATDWTGDLLTSADAFAKCAERYQRTGFTDLVVPWPRPEGTFAGDPSVLRDIASEALPHVHAL